MLSYLLEKTTSVVSSAYDLVTDTAEYVIDDIKSIPDAIEKGWDNPIISDPKEPESETATNTVRED